MARVRISRKKLLKEPDEFISTTGQILNFVKSYRKGVMIGFGLLVVLIFVGVSWRGHLKKRNVEASDLYYEAYQQFRKAEDGLLAESETREGFESALKRFERIVSGFGRTRYALISQLYQGHCLYQLERYDEAIEAYKKFIVKGSTNKPLIPFAIQSIAYAYRAKGDYEESNRYFKQILDKQAGEDIRLSVLIEIGRNHEILNETDKALEIYEEVIEAYPDDRSMAMIKEKVKRLRSTGSSDS